MDTQFVQAIKASPHDDLVRLVYCDWLEENGYTDRAEFIRSQVEQGELPYGEVRQYCAERHAQRLIESNLDRWNEDLPPWARKVCDEARYQSYRRGLPAVIYCDATDWLERADEVLGRYAIEEVMFSWYTFRPLLDRWLRSPFTARVKRFTLSGQYLTDADLRALADCPALAHVEKLDLSHNSFGDGGGVALAESLNLARLQELDLAVTNLGPDGFRAITQSHRLPALRRLDVGHNHSAVGDDCMGDLERSPHRYERIVLYGTAITVAGVELLCRAPCVAGIKHLDLGGNTLSAAAATTLANSPNLEQLEELSLINNPIGDAGATAIGRSQSLSRLRSLHLLRTQMGPEGGSELGRAANLRNLVHLDLRHNYCGSDFLTALAESRPFPRLLDLRLNSTSLTGRALSAAAKSSALDGTLRLDLGNNEIDDRSIADLVGCDAIKKHRLLILNGNRITSTGAEALAASMPPQMSVLILSDNLIEDEGALAFLDTLPINCNLVLHGNPISEAVWSELEEVLGDSFTFEYSDDLLSIPQRQPNRPPLQARNTREPVSNTIVLPTLSAEDRQSEEDMTTQ